MRQCERAPDEEASSTGIKSCRRATFKADDFRFDLGNLGCTCHFTTKTCYFMTGQSAL
jgi:hypothetical protein